MYSKFQSSRYRRLDWDRQACLPNWVSRAKKKTEMRLKENDDDMKFFPTWIHAGLLWLASRGILKKLTGGTLILIKNISLTGRLKLLLIFSVCYFLKTLFLWLTIVQYSMGFRGILIYLRRKFIALKMSPQAHAKYPAKFGKTRYTLYPIKGLIFGLKIPYTWFKIPL